MSVKPPISKAKRTSRKGLIDELASAADPDRAVSLAWFFKTGKGEYGEGDKFIGITVPQLRKIALRYADLPLPEIAKLLASRIHEHRSAALEILVRQYQTGDARMREEIFNFYLQHTNRVNNWDLVDASARDIVGEHLRTRQRELLDRLAASTSIWERRIAIVATFALIKDGEIEDTFRIAEKLLSDRHDLIHKAVGWLLRETGKISRPALLRFLEVHYHSVPRTALRYAIEHLPPDQRKRILRGDFSRSR